MTGAVIYEHSQRSFYWVAVGAFILAVAGIPVALGEPIDALGTLALVLFTAIITLLVAAFARLTTTVTRDEVVVRFTWGWPRRVIQRHDILAHQPVRNRWIYGWGVRWIPRGMLWNVWGLDAVELMLGNGRRFRIGTDDPTGLDAALTL